MNKGLIHLPGKPWRDPITFCIYRSATTRYRRVCRRRVALLRAGDLAMPFDAEDAHRASGTPWTTLTRYATRLRTLVLAGKRRAALVAGCSAVVLYLLFAGGPSGLLSANGGVGANWKPRLDTSAPRALDCPTNLLMDELWTTITAARTLPYA